MPTTCITFQLDSLVLTAMPLGLGSPGGHRVDPLSSMGHVGLPVVLRGTDHVVLAGPAWGLVPSPPRMPSPRPLTFRAPSANGGGSSRACQLHDQCLSPITPAQIPKSVFHVPPALRTTALSGAGLCVFHLFSQHEARRQNLDAIRECLLTWDVEQKRTFAHQTPAGPAGHLCSFPGEASCPADTRRGQAHVGAAAQCLAAGGPCVSSEMRSPTSPPAAACAFHAFLVR